MMILLYILMGFGAFIFFVADPKLFFLTMFCLWGDISVSIGLHSIFPDVNVWVFGICLPIVLLLSALNPKLFWGIVLASIFIIGYGFIFMVLILVFLGKDKKSNV